MVLRLSRFLALGGLLIGGMGPACPEHPFEHPPHSTHEEAHPPVGPGEPQDEPELEPTLKMEAIESATQPDTLRAN